MDAYESGYGDDLMMLMNLVEDREQESDDEELENLMVNCAVYGNHPMCAGMKLDESDDEELQFQNLNMFKKMGKGLKKFEKKAK